MDHFPRSFKELYACYSKGIHPRTIWDPVEEFFNSHGLRLWMIGPGLSQTIAPDSRPRAPDGFQYRSTPSIDWEHPFLHQSGMLCPARTTDGRDVVIRIISIGDEGSQHKEALQRLSTGNVASVIGNHAIPVLQWLHLDDLTFAVFPYLSGLDPSTTYAYENLSDLLRQFMQMLEAISFCHSKLVAHRDVFEGNFLSNFCGGVGYDMIGFYDASKGPVKPFRSVFPFKVYLIDFEMAVCFDYDSPASTHLVAGKPWPDDFEYLRAMAPELLTDQPYNPFQLDVWQLGSHFSRICNFHYMHPCTLELIEKMTDSTPSRRPTSAECMVELRALMSRLTPEELQSAVTPAR